MPKFDPAAVKHLARVCHEANRAHCIELGDESQAPWDEAPVWQRESAVAGVEFALGHPHATPALSHQRWVDRKVAEGWTYGEAKDATAKTHPCLLPWDKLPLEQRIKDALFLGVVRALAPLAGVKMGPAAVPPQRSVEFWEGDTAMLTGREIADLGFRRMKVEKEGEVVLRDDDPDRGTTKLVRIKL